MTAVEWFAMITKELGYVSEAQLEQAKKIHKEQIKDAWDNGCTYVQENSEQYYNETFKTK
jgi:hypothetical protein